jgi:type II secretory pathway component PulJ
MRTYARPPLSDGFTLIEVLIASVILFASITVISESYRASLAAGQRATATAEMLTPLPLITSTIRASLRERPEERLNGEGELLGVRYSFEAVTVRFEPPPPTIDIDLQDIRTFAPRYRLYDVRLSLERRSARRQFIYQELAWLPQLD